MRCALALACVLALVACVAATPLARLHSGAHGHSGAGTEPLVKPIHHDHPPKPDAPVEHKPKHPDHHTTPTAPAHHSNETKGDVGAACSFNGLSGVCQTVSSCDGTSIANHCSGANNIQCCITQGHFAAGCGKAAIQRAMTWVNMQLLYCQSANGQRDYDSDCSSVCHRAVNKHWDAYRSDCSGFVSYVYGLPAPGRDTSNFAPFENDISFTIKPEDLSAGDAINSVPAEHIMLFVRWTSADRTSAELIEEPGCSANPPYARVTESAVRITSDGKLFVAANGMTFQPIRFKSNSPTC